MQDRMQDSRYGIACSSETTSTTYSYSYEVFGFL